MGYTILADSNLDWGQNRYYLQQYLKRNPDVLFLNCNDGRFEIGDGKQFVGVESKNIIRVVVEVNRLVGITSSAEVFKWLKQNKIPVDNVAYSYLVFELEPKDLQYLLNAETKAERC
jgi:hypothetical protein